MDRRSTLVFSRTSDQAAFTSRLFVDVGNEFLLALDVDAEASAARGETVIRRTTIDLVPMAVALGCQDTACLCKRRMAASGRGTAGSALPFLLRACPERHLLRDVQAISRLVDVDHGPEANWPLPPLAEIPQSLAMTLDVARGTAAAAGQPLHPVFTLITLLFGNGQAPDVLFFEEDRLVLEAPGVVPTGVLATHVPQPRPGARLS